MKLVLPFLAVLAAFTVCLAPKAQADSFQLGVSDPNAIPVADVAALGASWNRELVFWHGETNFTGSLSFTAGVETFVAVTGYPSVPTTTPTREAFASFVASMLLRYPQVAGVVVWNEPNIVWTLNPEQYAQLLQVVSPVVRSYGAKVIGPGFHPNDVANPQPWLNALKAAGPHLLDVLTIHPYFAFEHDADFVRAARAILGWNIPVWVAEDGIESDPTANLWQPQCDLPLAYPVLYCGDQPSPLWNWHTTEAVQAVIGVQHMDEAYCAGIQRWAIHLLVDEADISRWQSGLKRPDGSYKPIYDAVAAEFRRINSGQVDCSVLPQPLDPPARIKRSLRRAYPSRWRNQLLKMPRQHCKNSAKKSCHRAHHRHHLQPRP